MQYVLNGDLILINFKLVFVGLHNLLENKVSLLHQSLRSLKETYEWTLENPIANITIKLANFLLE